MLRNPELELFEPTSFVYPKGYFQAQTTFADKILQLRLSPNIQSALLNYTVVYRHLVGRNPSPKGPNQKWLEFVHGLSREKDINEQVWQFYIRQPHSVYRAEPSVSDRQRFGCFIQKPAIDKLTGDQKIELHFTNQRRDQPKSDFSRQFTGKRIQDLTRLFRSVQEHIDSDDNYNPKWVTLVSWMNNLPGVRASLPPIFVDNGSAVRPPELNFRSNSLWGQFLTNNGGVNYERYWHFQENLHRSANLDQLVDSFPIPVCSFRSPISIFFEFYDIK